MRAERWGASAHPPGMQNDFVTDRGLVRTADFLRTHSDVRDLTRAVLDGRLIKLRRGAYADATVWSCLDDRGRHLLLARAVACDSAAEPVLAAHSAAAIWGMPALAFGDRVAIQERWKGGGRSAPGVRRIAAGNRSVVPERHGGHLVTSIARTALELTRTEPFSIAVGSMDWALWERNPLRVTRENVLAELDRLPQRFGIERARRVLRFATHLSDSFGESWFRALVHELGFAPPVLQQPWSIEGQRYRTDYWWPQVNVVGEFDGKGKYLRSWREGDDPGEAVWREKKREDAIRTRVRTVIRPVWADLFEPGRVARALEAAGIPRLRPRRG